MPHVQHLARWARSRAESKPVDLAPGNVKGYTSIHEAFHKRLLNACRLSPDNPRSAPDTLFIAVPERLLSKISYLCMGNVRKAPHGTDASRPASITDDVADWLLGFDHEGRNSHFINLDSSDGKAPVKKVLLCHGLSPIEDSICLLADIGRSYRVSRVLGLPMHVMLADISWMSSNRSIRQFESLSERDIDTGLRVCLDKRTRLYDALGIASRRHEIVPFDKAKSISGKKLEQISSRYRDLAYSLWGEDASGKLERDCVKRISAPLERLALQDEDWLPQYMAVLGQFPGVMAAIEDRLKPHLAILRVIAQQFTSFDEEIFSYFFAQYYAQDGYRGSVLKVAPVSERVFDESFDKLDPYFRAWGEGHSTTDVLTGSFPTERGVSQMSALYAPQYMIGKFEILPYTPLSLDTLTKSSNRDHNVVRDNLILLSDTANLPASIEANVRLLLETPVIARGRLLGDVCSFLALCEAQGHRAPLDSACLALGYASLSELLSGLWSELPTVFERDSHAPSEDLNIFWSTWLENLEVQDRPSYMPLHMYFYLLSGADWTEDTVRRSGALIFVAQHLYSFLT